MSFLSWTLTQALLATAATATVIVVLYWLKPPPRRVTIPSSMLWNLLMKERKRSSLIDRLRWWISLLLALAIGLSVAAAVGRPVFGSTDRRPQRIAIVVDNSPTMATHAMDGRSRWDNALDEARAILRRANEASEFLVVDTQGQVGAARFGSRREAFDALDSLAIEEGRVPAFPPFALDGVDAYFVTDGVSVKETPPEVQMVTVFAPADNVAITAFDIRPVPANPAEHEAYVEVTNYSPLAKEVSVQLSGAGQNRIRTAIRLQPGESMGGSFDLASFERGPVRAVIGADGDGLDVDNFAFGYLPVRTRTLVVLVTPGNVYLETLLELDPRVVVLPLNPEEFDNLAGADVYVFDRYAPEAPPPGPVILFGPPAVDWLQPVVGQVEAPGVAEWETHHPLMQFVSLEDLAVDRTSVIETDSREAPRQQEPAGASRPQDAAVMLESGVEVVASTARAPLIVAGFTPTKFVHVAFQLDASNFALQPGFPIFMSNALAWVMDEQLAMPRRMGRVEVPLAAARITALDGEELQARHFLDRTVFRATAPGLYTAAGDNRRLHVAVNLLDRAVSDVNRSTLAPRDRPAERVTGEAPEDNGGWHEEVWFFLVLAALTLVAIEWWSYHRRWTV